jgi:hypothetical protein
MVSWAVAAISESSIWAVGTMAVFITDGDFAYFTQTEHWTGTSWNLVSNPNPGTTQDSLQATTAIPATGDVRAVGYEVGSAAYQTLIEQCQGC